MASIVLGRVGSAVGGGIAGGVGAGLGQFLGNFAGQALDRKLFGNTHHVTESRRLEGLKFQTSAYGNPIPIIYGTMRLSGNVIWVSKIEERKHSQTTTNKNRRTKVKHTHRSYTYNISLAIAICEGEIYGIDRIWADGSLLNTNSHNIRIHKGGKDQLPDPLIESIYGIGKTPAYRGLAYVVIEDLQLQEFENRVPNFSFEVKRHTPSHQVNKLEDLIEGVVMIPGSGEFVYDTVTQTKINGDIAGNKWVQRGNAQYVNQHNSANVSNSILSLDQMQETLPNVKWVSPVACWFATSNNLIDCKIMPGVEFKEGGEIQPDQWSVAGYSRGNAYQISKIEDKVSYGGSVNDKSILRYIEELRNRKFQVMFYPMFLVDTKGKPWRGRITGSYRDVKEFFNKKYGYNEFILHYANLVKGEVDAFVIGSELIGLTMIRDQDNNFPAVNELIDLAAKVKRIMGSKTKIIYSADWSEYHHTDGGWYNLDPLWASPNIDVIGIDSYFPLTDSSGSENLDEVIKGWDSGEGYDFIYKDGRRLEKETLKSSYAWKNIEWWWNNYHYNPDGKKTEWQPRSKKIWFTEFGFPSVDCASNQPNVFFDSTSVESAFPRYSKGNIDLSAQRIGLYATVKRWQNSQMIEQKFVWCWDARPYPSWPNFNKIWSDVQNWSRGHWIQGKLNSVSLAQVLSDLCIKSGLEYDDFDVSAINDSSVGINFFGFIIDGQRSVRKSIEMLQSAYFFDVVENGGKLNFIPRKSKSKVIIPIENLVPNSNGEKVEVLDIKRIQDMVLPQKISISYIDRFSDYGLCTQYHTKDKGGKFINFNMPIISDKNSIQGIAKTAMHNIWMERVQYSFMLPAEYIHLAPADIVSLRDGENEYCLRITNFDIGKNGLIKVSGVGEDASIYSQSAASIELSEPEDVRDSSTHFEILDIPYLPNEEKLEESRILLACCGVTKNWAGSVISYLIEGEEKFFLDKIHSQATMGRVLTKLPSKSPYLIDKTSEIIVNLMSGHLLNMKNEEFFSGDNLALIGNEIIQFKNAQLLKDNQYKITHFFRGQQGTEHEISNHSQGDRFILLDKNVIDVELPISYLSQKVKWCVENSEEFQMNEAHELKFEMQNLKPLAPINIKVKQRKKGVYIVWDNRSINNDMWSDFNDVAEGREVYNIAIFREGKLIFEDSTNTKSYQLANDKLDFTKQYEIHIRQISPKAGFGNAAIWNSTNIAES